MQATKLTLQNFDATFQVKFDTTLMDTCRTSKIYNSKIVLAHQPIETVQVSLLDPTPIQFQLEFSDTGTDELATITGFETQTCGTFEVVQVDLFEMVSQDSADDRLFWATSHGDYSLVGEHSLNLLVISIDYADYIEPLRVTVPVASKCDITHLVDDGASGYSPIIPVALPIVATIKLPLYEPDVPCFDLTNANVVYSFVQDPPEWLVLD